MAADPQDYRTIPAGEFKNRCLALMDEVNETGAEIVITKHGRPVSRLVPARRQAPEMWGRYREQVRISGDIVAPAVPAGEWEAIATPATTLDPDSPPQS
ncbi:MAG: type II toxin-antitoxin system Phd/YefM family antitoxin [bacterium]|nr:type II toxin-antitoxin system Phd/YefM family antitoxin [bacterium]MXV89680.1 type II toxin-antitoxin system Phd/YefM family antitoxin [Acidimicrobiia bacterium]MYC44968.1 type II toxin-antitoxin system Phd/YefM family antitoxin [Acidimicrobiia bacterium]MYI19564.1 type II toxin-antitoxin system Phd/YefM family antitoxin [Acidimicrobiia bacterium]